MPRCSNWSACRLALAMQLTPNVSFSIMPWSKFNMICSQQRRLNPMLRICAALMVLVWVAASGFCSVESFFGHAEHNSNSLAHHENDTAASTADSDHHSHDSDKNGSEEHSCCATLTAASPSVNSAILAKPDFGKLLSLNFLWLAQALTFVQPEVPISRQPPDREWVFTPEICLGPAFRSHAPPLAA